FDRRRTRTDLHFVPVVLFGLYDELGLPPKTQIWRVGNPDGPGSDFRMRTIKPGIEPVKLRWKNNHVPIIRLRYEGDFIHMFEIPRLSKGDSHPISRVGAVCDDVLAFQRGHARVLHPELLIGGERAIFLRSQKRRWRGGEVESIGTTCQPDDGPSRAKMGAEEHNVLILMFHHRGVVNGFYWIRYLGFGKDGVPTVSSDNVRCHNRSSAWRAKTLAYTRSYASTIVSTEKHCRTRLRHSLRSISDRRSKARTASLTLSTKNPVRPSLMTSRQEPRSMAITGTPAALASTRTSPNRSGIVFMCNRARARANNSFLPRTSTGPI